MDLRLVVLTGVITETPHYFIVTFLLDFPSSQCKGIYVYLFFFSVEIIPLLPGIIIRFYILSFCSVQID